MKHHVTIKIQKIACQKTHIKYLRVIIDSTLSWKHQTKNITCKISRAIGIMYKLRPFLNSTMMKNIFYSIIYSHIVCVIQVWGSAGKIETGKILVLQKRTIRLISNKDKKPVLPGPLASTNPIFFKLEILKVKDIFTLQISKFIYRCLKLDTPDNFHEWFKLNCVSHSYNTRSNFIDNNNIVKSNNIFILGGRTSFYGLRLIKVAGPKLWNELPNYIHNNNSLISFVKCLKNYLLQKYT